MKKKCCTHANAKKSILCKSEAFKTVHERRAIALFTKGCVLVQIFAVERCPSGSGRVG